MDRKMRKAKTHRKNIMHSKSLPTRKYKSWRANKRRLKRINNWIKKLPISNPDIDLMW
jgi:hypothetical protein